ncbi:MAG TPA: SMC-Scp complex subunit ScpB [Myxococcota bacterium]|jgi:segregation and condensation protein B
MERSEQLSIAEALILASPEPLPLARLASLIPSCKPAAARALVDELNAEYAMRGRAFEIWEVAGGFQLRTLPAFASYVQASQPERPLRLSQAALETLSVIAYRQPVTRAEIEHVRGVDASVVLRSLLERDLVRIAGHREVPGRPLLYATSRRFLEVFGLARIEDLPTLRELAELAPEGPAGAPMTPDSVGLAPPSPSEPDEDDDEIFDDEEADDGDPRGESH